MSVEVEPAELVFRRPFTQEITEVLRLKNNNPDPVAFKVKTTAPKQYCVRPNSGRIESGQVVEIAVLLQAMKEEPPPEFKSRDKFLVQSVAVPAEAEIHNVAAIWSNIEQTAKSSIQEKKIRVNFMPPDGFLTAGSASTPQRESTRSHLQDGEPPAYNSPMSTAGTPQQRVTYASPAATRVIEPEGLGEVRSGPYSKHVESHGQVATPGPTSQTTSTGANEQQSVVGAATASVSAAASSVVNALPSTDDIKAQLEDARAQIARLMSQQSSDSGLRQRKGDGVSTTGTDRISTGNTGMGMRQAPPSGVPVPMVAALCLLSFLLAYFMF